jgi:hypothetical protein
MIYRVITNQTDRWVTATSHSQAWRLIKQLTNGEQILSVREVRPRSEDPATEPELDPTEDLGES